MDLMRETTPGISSGLPRRTWSEVQEVCLGEQREPEPGLTKA